MVAMLVAAAALVAAPTVAEPLEYLTPSGKWRVDYGETQCAALREYGPADSRQMLAIRPAPNGESFEILWLRPGVTGRFADQLEGSVDFGRGQIRSTVLHYSDRRSQTMISKYRLVAADMAQARQASRIAMRLRGESDVGIIVTNMAAVMDQLDKCTANLRQHWNDVLSGPAVVAVPAKTRRDLHRLFTSSDYPADAIKEDQTGRSQVMLLIDEKGDVASCYVAQPSGIAVIDAMSCQVIVQRGKFEPARDSAGRPVRSIFYSPYISWRIAR